jgi:hypothetical protein
MIHRECGHHYSISQTKMLMATDPEVFNDEQRQKIEMHIDDLQQLFLIDTLSKSVSNWQTCPSCRKYGVVAERQKADIKCERSDCGKKWCLACRRAGHTPHPCGFLSDPTDDTVRLLIEETLADASVHTCPSCRRKINKVVGCNRISCVCGIASCYVCGERCPDMVVDGVTQHYYHFHRPGSKCILFNDTRTEDHGNLKFTEDRMRRAVLQMLTVNKTQPPKVIETFTKEIRRHIKVSDQDIATAVGKKKNAGGEQQRSLVQNNERQNAAVVVIGREVEQPPQQQQPIAKKKKGCCIVM